MLGAGLVLLGILLLQLPHFGPDCDNYLLEHHQRDLIPHMSSPGQLPQQFFPFTE